MTKGEHHNEDHDSAHNVSNFFSNQLQDGFHEIFTFKGHRLQLRGLKVVDWAEDNRRQSGFYHRQHFLSWDVKQVLLWRQDFFDSQNEPQPNPVLIHQVRFSNQPNFICAIVHVPRLKVFLAAALDMSFKIFDKTLVQLESIRHEERAILEIEYDSAKDILFTSGASGVSAWKLYRNTSLDKAHVMEKLYSFQGCTDWITKMICEPRNNRVYALKERTAQVLGITRRSVVATLEDCHEAPINVVCWYERNQFYITGCSRGEIKCWTSNYNHSGMRNGGGGGSSSRSAYGNSDGGGGGGSGKVFALLHTFVGHSRAVTGIRLHPISGLAISTGMDGFVKVLNLEALNELFSIRLDTGILSMNVIKMGSHGYGCLMTLADASIKLWKITSVCDFFATSSTRIGKLESFENLEAELEHFYRLKYLSERGHAPQPSSLLDSTQKGGADRLSPSLLHEKEQDDDDDEDKEGKDHPRSLPLKPGEHAEGAADESDHQPSDARMGQAESDTEGGVNDRILVTYSSQDLRCFTQTGTLLGRLEPEHIVDGIKAVTVSVYQKLLFCLCERDRIRVHCLRRFAFPLVFELSLQGNKTVIKSSAHTADAGPSPSDTLGRSPSPTVPNPASPSPVPPLPAAMAAMHLREDMGTCCALIDVAPTNAMRAPKSQSGSNVILTHHGGAVQGATSSLPSSASEGTGGKHDARGHPIADHISSYLLVGLNTGAILFLDTLNNFEVQMNFQANNGAIQEIKYRRRLRELIVLSQDFSETFSSVRIWRMPDLELITEVSDLRRVTCFSISMSLPYFAVGTATGNVKLFTVEGAEKQVKEIGRMSEHHDQAVSALTFCDDIRVLCSAAEDCRVKFWDMGKRLVRTIQLNTPTCGVVQNGAPGDVLMAQSHYLLTIPMRIWDEGDLLAEMKKQIEAAAAIASGANQSPFQSQAGRIGSGRGNEEEAGRAQGTAASSHAGSSSSAFSSMAGVVQTVMGGAGSMDNAGGATTTTTSHGGLDDESSSTLYSRRTSRRNSKRMVKVSEEHNTHHPSPASSVHSATEPRKAGGAAEHKKIQSPLSAIPAAAPPSQDMETATREAEEFEQRVLLPQLQQQQFCFFSHKGDPARSSPLTSAPEREVAGEPTLQESSVYSRMQQYNLSGGPPRQETSLPFKGGHRPSEPFVFDTLHPRFLLHKRPPARAVQLEDLEETFSAYLSRSNALKAAEGQQSDLLDRYKPSKAAPMGASGSTTARQDDTSPSRRKAQFGLLSPRARLTLLSSYDTSPSNHAARGGVPSSSDSGHAHGSSSLDFSASPSSSSSTTSSSMAHLVKTHEKIICTAAIGMRVSESYRKHRESINHARKQRIQDLSKRASVSLSDTDKNGLWQNLQAARARAEGLSQLAEQPESDGEDSSLQTPSLLAGTPSTTTAFGSPIVAKTKKASVFFADDGQHGQATPMRKAASEKLTPHQPESSAPSILRGGEARRRPLRPQQVAQPS